MDTIRIFISSPGDVVEERDRARQVVEGLRRRYAGRLYLKPVLWEELPLQAGMSFQEGIDQVLSQEHGIDVAVFIVWSRLGTPLGWTIRREDGGEYRSGTERELDLMLAAWEQSGRKRPQVLVYTRRDEASFDERLRGRPTAEKEELIAQKKLVEQFIREEFHDVEGGHNVRAAHSFDRPVTFAQRLRVHLTELLDRLAGGVREAVWDVDKQGPPFMGLETFQAKQADVFFGREAEVLQARHVLKKQAQEGCAFLLLSGASGSGKSSLVRAGLVPEIVANEVDEQVIEWRPVVVTAGELGSDALAGLVRGLAQVVPELRGPDEGLEAVTAGMRRDPELTVALRVKEALVQASWRRGGGVRILLVLDQLEELFASAGVSATERRELLSGVEALARSGQVWVVATVRSDFWAQVEGEPALVRMQERQGLLPVLAPDADALRRVIEEPAACAGLQFEQRDGQSLAGRILADAAAHAELLPLVEYTLRELYEQRTGEGVLAWAVYEQLGGVEGALAKRAEEVFRALPGEAQEALPALFKALVTVTQAGQEGSGEQVVRQRVPLADVTAEPGAASLVHALVEERLLTTADQGGLAVVTVAHESLLRVWPRARAWVEQNAEFLRVRARVESRLSERSPLLEGDPLLEAAKAHLARDPKGFTSEQRKFIEHSANRADAVNRRKEVVRTYVTSALVVLVLAIAVAAAFAFQGRHALKLATAKQQTMLQEASSHALSRAIRLVDDASRADWTAFSAYDTAERMISESLLELARAVSLNSENQLAREAFGWLVTAWREVLRQTPTAEIKTSDLKDKTLPADPLQRSARSPFNEDGTKLILLDGNRAYVVDTVTGRRVAELVSDEPIVDAEFDTSGTRLVARSSTSVTVWDVTSNEPVSVIRSLKGLRITRISPDGKRLFTLQREVGRGEAVSIWDAATGMLLTAFDVGYNEEFDARFSADGAKLLSVRGNTHVLDSQADIRNAKTGRTVVATSVDPLPRSSRAFFDLNFGESGARVVIQNGDRANKVVDIERGKDLLVLPFQGEQMRLARFSADGTHLAAIAGDPIRGQAVVFVWNIRTTELIAKFEHLRVVRDVTLSRDGTWLATLDEAGAVRVWPMRPQAGLGRRLVTRDVAVVAFSSDGNNVMTLATDGSVRTWGLKDRSFTVTTVPAFDEHVPSTWVSNDGRRTVFVGTRKADNQEVVGVWDTQADSPVFMLLRSSPHSVSTLGISGDGTHMIVGGPYAGADVSVWNVNKNDRVASIPRQTDHVAINADGSKALVVSRDLREVEVWDTTNSKVTASLHHHHDIKGVAFNVTGSRIATWTKHIVRLWDSYSGRMVASFPDVVMIPGSYDVAALVDGAHVSDVRLTGNVSLDVDLWNVGMYETRSSRLVSWDTTLPNGLATSHGVPTAYETLAAFLTGRRFAADGTLRDLSTVELDKISQDMVCLGTGETAEARLAARILGGRSDRSVECPRESR